MGKKMVLAVFGGIALFGLVLAIVGFALGGRLGAVGVEDGKLVYYTGNDSVAFSDAPAWMQSWRGRFYNIGIGGLSAVLDDDRDGASATAALSLPSFAGDIEAVDIDISAGYLHVVSGEEYSLQVDGEMEYTSEFENGTWQIRSHHAGGIDLRSGGRRFWLNGRDITTTFTLVLPPQCGALDLTIGVGQASVTGLALDALNCEASAGSLRVQNTDAASAHLTVSAGDITAAGLNTGVCELHCDAGRIQMEGDITTSLHASCAAGAVAVSMPAPADYGWNSEVGMGKATVDGHGAAGLGGRGHGGNPHARPFFDLECDMGNIEIVFT